MSLPGRPVIRNAPRASPNTLEYYWFPPTNTGGNVIEGYQLSLNPGGITCNIAASELAPTFGYYKVTGLTNAQTYTTTIAASTINGYGPTANFRAFQPGSPPLVAPSTATATVVGQSNALISWTPPTTIPDATIFWYVLRSKSSNPADPVLKFTANGQTMSTFYVRSGFNINSIYSFSVNAVNCPGYSPPTSTNTIQFFKSFTYTIGSGGAGGVGSQNGSTGGTTTFIYLTTTLTATGGSGGLTNQSVVSAGGTFSGGDGGANGGTGGGASGDTGGGGGGGLGVNNNTNWGIAPGQDGKAVNSGNVSGLGTAVAAVGGNITAFGAGSQKWSESDPDFPAFQDKANGCNATGVGCGGGGGSWYGGNGGNGFFGGGGGGAGGFRQIHNGGQGGSGFVMCQFTTGGSSTYIMISTPTSGIYTIPLGTTQMKIWVVGGGGGGGGVPADDGTAAAAGGAGGITWKTITL